jgi:hypothetical protein
MSFNLLVIYEIADKASRVTSRAALREYEQWVRSVLAKSKDAVVEQVARRHLFQLKDRFALPAY